MKILVTGATGLVGANTVRQLLDDGHDVRVGLRSSSNRLGIAGLDVEEVPLYLDRPDTLSAAVTDCEAVIHAAAAVWVGRTGRDWLTRANVDGTDALLRACAEAGVKRVVHVSSVDALGIRSLEHPADEETPPNMGWLDCAYVDTKREAEQVVLRWVEDGLDAVIVNPAFMLGPWDTRPTSGALLLEVASGKAVLAPHGGNCFVDVRDVAWGIAAALDRGQTGRRYILGGVNLTYYDAWTRIAHIVGSQAPVGLAPRWAAWLTGQLGSAWGAIATREPAINPVTVAMGQLPHYFDSSRARAELGYPHTDIDRAIRDAWAWFQTHGYHSVPAGPRHVSAGRDTGTRPVARGRE